MDLNINLPILGFAAYSGTGKTTLLEALLPKLGDLKIGVLKHAHHNFDIDKEGKDSYRLRKAGAMQMLISSRYRYALINETPDSESEFKYLLSRFDSSKLDLILVEGCKNIAFPKIELHRHELGKPWLHPQDPNIIAVAADSQITDLNLPYLDINNLDAIAQFVINYCKQYKHIDHNQNNDQPSNCCDHLPSDILSVTKAQELILASLTPTNLIEKCKVKNSYNRILATNFTSNINVPAYDNSAMDGYAICYDDPSITHYKVVGQVLAGYSYDQVLQPAQAVKIMTGAPMPQGANTVIMREVATQEGDLVSFSDKIKRGQNVRCAGEDLKQGSLIFKQGTKIVSPHMGMISSLGIDSFDVYRPLKVAIFSTGDEILDPSADIKDNAIYDSNRFTITGILTRLNCEILDLGILPDDPKIMHDALTKASLETDLIITSGGVSVGDADHIKDVLKQLGSINFWRVNMRPGRPLSFGKINSTPFFGLPGNPVAVMVSLLNFVEPAIYKLQGIIGKWQPLKMQAIARENLRSRQGRTEFSRGIYSIDPNGKISVRTTGKQGSGILYSMSIANCLIEIDPAQDMIKEGETVTIIPLQGRL